MYLLISSKGEIDSRALSLIGGSTKRNDAEKIGFFGSGNKYALAVLLRNKIPFEIYSGINHIEITTKQVTMRDTSFNAIVINGKETDLTDSMGPKWNPWMAVREFYSNAIDEGNHMWEVVDEINPQPDITSFYITLTPELEKIHNERELYFSDFRKDLIHYNTEVGEIYPKSGIYLNLYRKGIRCLEDEKQSAFDYNFYKLDINESRIVMDNYGTYRNICKIWAEIAESTNSDVMFQLFRGISGDYTTEMYSFDWYGSSQTYSKAWHCLSTKSVAPKRLKSIIEADYYFPMDLIKGLQKSKVPFISVVNNDAESPYNLVQDGFIDAIIAKAHSFLCECKIETTIEIVPAHFVDEEVVLSIINVEQRKIAISASIIKQGVKATVVAMIQGQAALNAKSSKNYGKFIADEFVTYIQKQNSYIL